MRHYVCAICGYVYSEADGHPEGGVAPGTLWADVPDTWECPICGAEKADFSLKEQAPAETQAPEAVPAPVPVQEGEMSAAARSVLCSNLARGSEKQYLPEISGLFTQLADYFRAQSAPAEQPALEALDIRLKQDEEAGLPAAREAAARLRDRGALRALTWAEKVTKMQATLLRRYQKAGDDSLADANVYVCSACGFIFVGDEAPGLCPVCKVPAWKFEQMDGRAS